MTLPVIELAPALAEVQRSLAQEIHRETHELALVLAREFSPVRTGKLRAGWHSVPASPESAIEANQPTKIRNASPYAKVIDQGRRRSENAFQVRKPGGGRVVSDTKRRRKDGTVVQRAHAASFVVPPGKMLGSEQAPMGIKRAVYRELDARQEAIVAAAAASVDRG